MTTANRVTALEYHLGRDLRPHPKNPRLHPDGQVKAMAGILEQVGIAGALIAYRAGDGVLTLIDGHCRGEHWADVEWPVIVLDVTDEEADLVLVSHDPLAGMANVDESKMQALLDSVEIECLDLLEALQGNSFDVGEIDAPELASGDKEPFQQMTFTLHDSQADIVRAALDIAKKAGAFTDSPNENSNGNALARICKAYNG
jgi:hypothetical protein